MTEITVVIRDAEVRRMLRRATKGIDKALRYATADSLSYLLQEQKAYPSPPPGSRYIRTNTLKDSWDKQGPTKTSSGWRGIVGSNANVAPYNRYVQDSTRQARIHRGRWINTVQGTAKRSRRTIASYYEARIRQFVR